MRVSKEAMLDELIPDDQVKIAQDSDDMDLLEYRYFRAWVFLNDGTLGFVNKVIDSNTLDVEVYSGGSRSEEDLGNKSNWRKTQVPISSVDRFMTDTEKSDVTNKL